jgi:hypothetical protein
MGDYKMAGQFKIEGGQLVQLIPGGKNTYLAVNGTKDLGGNAIPVYFSAEPNKIGRFTFSGDTLIFHDDGGQVLKDNKKEQNAWLVCPNKAFQLFINLKYFGDKSTPCSSHTIHWFNAATAYGPNQ